MEPFDIDPIVAAILLGMVSGVVAIVRLAINWFTAGASARRIGFCMIWLLTRKPVKLSLRSLI